MNKTLLNDFYVFATDVLQRMFFNIYKKFTIMEIPYVPINCHFYDELELLAIRRKACLIVYRNEVGEQLELVDIIVDFKIRAGAEYMLLKSAAAIRLDRLIRVDGKELAGFC